MTIGKYVSHAKHKGLQSFTGEKLANELIYFDHATAWIEAALASSWPARLSRSPSPPVDIMRWPFRSENSSSDSPVLRLRLPNLCEILEAYKPYILRTSCGHYYAQWKLNKVSISFKVRYTLLSIALEDRFASWSSILDVTAMPLLSRYRSHRFHRRSP